MTFGTGDVDRNVTITFIGRDQASRAMSSIGSSASRTSRIVGGLTKALKYAGIAAATALAAGAAIAAKALFDATKAAYYDNIAMQKLALVQRKAQDATDAQVASTARLIDKLELATGIADDEMRPALAALAGTGMEVERSQKLLTLAMDISVARGKSLTTVAEALAKAYNGNTGGLSRLGVQVKKANGDLLPLSEILATLEDRFKGAAKAAGKTDPLARLSAAWNQMQEKVGAGLLPVLRQFTKWVINEAVPWIKHKLVPAVKDLGQWIKDNQDTLKAWGEWIILTAKAIGIAVVAVGKFIAAAGRATTSIKRFFGLDTSFMDDLKVAFIVLQHPMLVFNQMMDTFIYMCREALYIIQALVTKIGELGNAFLNLPTGALGWVADKIGFSADGGWLDQRARGGWTMVGEHGPELINNKGFVKTHSQSMGEGGGGVTIHVHGAVDPVSTARQIERILAKGRRVTGGGGLATA